MVAMTNDIFRRLSPAVSNTKLLKECMEYEDHGANYKNLFWESSEKPRMTPGVCRAVWRPAERPHPQREDSSGRRGQAALRAVHFLLVVGP